jgi:hypothetical protein
MKETEALELLLSYCEGALGACADIKATKGPEDQEFYEGKMSALVQVIEEAEFIKVSYEKSNSK